MSSTEIFYHGTCHLFDRFSLSFLGEGEGKSKFGHGIYITSSYKTAVLYAAKAAKANDKSHCYVYTVEVPAFTNDNHIFSCKRVNSKIVSRTEKLLTRLYQRRLRPQENIFVSILAISFPDNVLQRRR